MLWQQIKNIYDEYRREKKFFSINSPVMSFVKRILNLKKKALKTVISDNELWGLVQGIIQKISDDNYREINKSHRKVSKIINILLQNRNDEDNSLFILLKRMEIIGILTQSSFKILKPRPDPYPDPYTIASALIALKDKNIFTRPNIDAILDSDNPSVLTNALVTLASNDNPNADGISRISLVNRYRLSISQHSNPKNLALALRNLHRRNMQRWASQVIAAEDPSEMVQSLIGQSTTEEEQASSFAHRDSNNPNSFFARPSQCSQDSDDSSVLILSEPLRKPSLSPAAEAGDSSSEESLPPSPSHENERKQPSPSPSKELRSASTPPPPPSHDNQENTPPPPSPVPSSSSEESQSSSSPPPPPPSHDNQENIPPPPSPVPSSSSEESQSSSPPPPPPPLQNEEEIPSPKEQQELEKEHSNHVIRL